MLSIPISNPFPLSFCRSVTPTHLSLHIPFIVFPSACLSVLTLNLFPPFGSPRFKSLIRIFVYFDSAWRLCFYFDCVHLTIGWRGLVALHIKGSTLKIKTRTTFRKARQIQSGLNHVELIT